MSSVRTKARLGKELKSGEVTVSLGELSLVREERSWMNMCGFAGMNLEI